MKKIHVLALMIVLWAGTVNAQKPQPRLARERRMILRRKKPEGIYRFSVVVRYLFGWRTFNKMM